jgi:hypothetical protein
MAHDAAPDGRPRRRPDARADAADPASSRVGGEPAESRRSQWAALEVGNLTERTCDARCLGSEVGVESAYDDSGVIGGAKMEASEIPSVERQHGSAQFSRVPQKFFVGDRGAGPRCLYRGQKFVAGCRACRGSE